MFERHLNDLLGRLIEQLIDSRRGRGGYRLWISSTLGQSDG